MKCSRIISVNKQTIGFQGWHGDKLCITYKAEGGGFQCNALCSNGFTYCFYFLNQPILKELLKNNTLPLNVQVLRFFQNIHNKYHCYRMGNLYTSAKFIQVVFVHSKKVMCHGVCRKSGRGVPLCVLQEEIKNK